MHGQINIPIIVLAGGKGTRLREMAPDFPKPMVPVKGRPFLHWLLTHYQAFGFTKFYLSVGYKAEVFEQYDWKGQFPETKVEICKEDKVLGTGGAIQWIFSEHKDIQAAWVINGDTFLPEALPDVPEGLEAHFTALKKAELFDAVPNLVVDGDKVVAVDKEKGQFFDAGAVYLERKAVERYTGEIPCSLQELLVPAMGESKVGYSVITGTCYDIGTPERFKRFEDYLC